MASAAATRCATRYAPVTEPEPLRKILLDTGAVIGLLKPADPHHGACERFFASLNPGDQLHTTWPVLTECTFAFDRNPELLREWLLGFELNVHNFGLSDAETMWDWSRRWRDRTVDFADASLAWLGHRLGTVLIATTDYRDFETYRSFAGKPFRILVERPHRR